MTEEYHQFYTDYRDKLFNYLFYRIGDRDVARDIVQESFTKHFKHYGRQAVNSPALLFTIARNTLTDYQRGKIKLYNAEIPMQKAALDVESSCIAREEHSRIHEVIRTLPEQDREILMLAVGGMAYKEIAAIFNLSIANVKVKVHRSRTRLRKELENKVQ